MVRDDEAAALRPTLLLGLVALAVIALVVFWPHKTIEAPTSKATPEPVAAATTASAPAAAPPPTEEITDEVIVMVAAPPLASTPLSNPPLASAKIAAASSAAPDAALENAPLALPVGPILTVEKTAPHNTEPDKTEPARVTTKIWDCPWPPRGAATKITQIKVHVKVSVTWDGRGTEVEVLDDPGYDFGEYAKKCALTQTYIPARDAEGHPANGTTTSFAVLFDRGGR